LRSHALVKKILIYQWSTSIILIILLIITIINSNVNISLIIILDIPFVITTNIYIYVVLLILLIVILFMIILLMIVLLMIIMLLMVILFDLLEIINQLLVIFEIIIIHFNDNFIIPFLPYIYSYNHTLDILHKPKKLSCQIIANLYFYFLLLVESIYELALKRNTTATILMEIAYTLINYIRIVIIIL